MSTQEKEMAEVVDGEIVEEPGTAIERAPSVKLELSVDELVARSQKIQEAMRRAMREGEHYGVIPGTGSKPTLLKPGAEKLCSMFLLDPEYDNETTIHDDGHYTVRAMCTLFHIPTGNRVASGRAVCSTKEAKYAYRQANRVCPSCGKDAIIKGKKEYGGGWICFKKKDGCGDKFQHNDPKITSQPVGRVPNPDLPDTWNTVEKMACKRALIAAVLNGTAASDIFTQDVGDPETTPAPESPENVSTRPDEASDWTPPPEPIENPCPSCGQPCFPTNSDKGPKWKCSNWGCKGNDGEPWISWHNDPWKDGGEIAQLQSESQPTPPADTTQPVEEGPTNPPASLLDGHSSLDAIKAALDADLKWGDVAKAIAFVLPNLDNIPPDQVPGNRRGLDKASSVLLDAVAEKLKLGVPA